MLGYPILCKFLQKYPGITQDNLVADAARRVLVRPRRCAACHYVCPKIRPKNGQKFGGAADEIKTWFLHLVQPLQAFEYWYARHCMRASVMELSSWPNRPKGDLKP